jgi:hypothetical protein
VRARQLLVVPCAVPSSDTAWMECFHRHPCVCSAPWTRRSRRLSRSLNSWTLAAVGGWTPGLGAVGVGGVGAWEWWRQGSLCGSRAAAEAGEACGGASAAAAGGGGPGGRPCSWQAGHGDQYVPAAVCPSVRSVLQRAKAPTVQGSAVQCLAGGSPAAPSASASRAPPSPPTTATARRPRTAPQRRASSGSCCAPAASQVGRRARTPSDACCNHALCVLQRAGLAPLERQGS